MSKTLVAIALAAVVGGTAVYLLSGPTAVHAADLRRDPAAYEGRTVSVVGTVVGSASLGGELLGGTRSGLLLDDGTGQIAVLLSGIAPSRGQRIEVRGRVKIMGSVSLPMRWLKALGLGGASDGTYTAVLLQADRWWVRQAGP